MVCIYVRSHVTINRFMLKGSWGVCKCRLNGLLISWQVNENNFFSEQSVYFNRCNQGNCWWVKGVWRDADVFMLIWRKVSDSLL